MSRPPALRLTSMRPVVVPVPARLTEPQSLVLRAHVEGLLRAGLPVVCRLGADVDLPALQLVARLRLSARRLGAPLEVRTTARGLVELTGLGEALGLCPDREDAVVPQDRVDPQDRIVLEDTVDPQYRVDPRECEPRTPG